MPRKNQKTDPSDRSDDEMSTGEDVSTTAPPAKSEIKSENVSADPSTLNLPETYVPSNKLYIRQVNGYFEGSSFKST